MGRHMKRCHGRLHYDRKFQIFIFLIGHINVNKGVFCLINSCLQIKSYNVLNYNNCSTDWPFPLRCNYGRTDFIPEMIIQMGNSIEDYRAAIEMFNTIGGVTLCTRHAHSKYIIDNQMFTIQLKNGR